MLIPFFTTFTLRFHITVYTQHKINMSMKVKHTIILKNTAIMQGHANSFVSYYYHFVLYITGLFFIKLSSCAVNNARPLTGYLPTISDFGYPAPCKKSARFCWLPPHHFGYPAPFWLPPTNYGK